MTGDGKGQRGEEGRGGKGKEGKEKARRTIVPWDGLAGQLDRWSTSNGVYTLSKLHK